MMSAMPLEDEFRNELRKLRFEVAHNRQPDADPNAIYKPMNRFLITWCDRFMDEQQAGGDIAQIGRLRDELFTAVREIEYGREPDLLRRHEPALTKEADHDLESER